MRIISGKYRGKQLIAPRNLPSRPTTDFAKEALFNIIQNYFHLEQIAVLDLFAGTGNISYECASRGVPNIVAVDDSSACVRFINQTAQHLGFTGIQAIRSDAQQFINRAYQTWDFIFADPPYDYKGHLELAETVFNKNLVNEGGLLIIEHGRDTALEAHPQFVETRKYGNVYFSIFEG